LSAWCTAQGRVIATIRVVRQGDGYRLVLARDLAERVAKRLKMFVLRARVGVTDASADVAVAGLIAPPPRLPAAANLEVDAAVAIDDGALVRSPGPTPRWLAIGSPSTLEALGADAGSVDATAWRGSDIDAGLPHVCAATTELFVPQMLNLDALAGVAFDKGCYPGQEIVARLRYRGGLKRRLYRAVCAGAAAPAPGTALYCDAAGPEESVGNVVDAVAGTDGVVHLTAVVVMERAGSVLRVGGASGPPLDLRPLPYPLPAA
jgi:hypothetical protein